MLIQRCKPYLFKGPSRFQKISVLLTTSVRKKSTPGKDCSELGASAVSVWDHSIKLVLPAWCGPPCSVAIRTTATTRAVTLAANRPDVWWGASEWPLGPDSPLAGSITPAVHAGGTLRVFGRALAWARDGSCVNGAAQPGPGQTTSLSLTDETGVATAPVVSKAASCYEAAFELPVGMTGRLHASVTTAWGTSKSFAVTVLPVAPAPAPVPPTKIDVRRDCSGDLALAMRKAAELPRNGQGLIKTCFSS